MSSRRRSFKFWILLIVIVVAGVYAWRRWSPYPITNAHPTGSTIVAFGDSLTYGTGAPEGEGYVPQLQRRIGEPILNRGVPGDTTEMALKRLDRDVLQADPKVVLLCLGGNDLLRRVDPGTTFQNLETMIRRIQDKGALVIVVGLGATPISPRLGGRYRALARRTGCPLVPDVMGGILGEPQLMSDGIHPNARGYTRMAEKIEPALREYLSK